MNASDLDILVGALTVYGEARGCTQAGRTAIAHTIINRAKKHSWWGKIDGMYPDHSIAAVCLKPWQYSCWNANDPNSALLENLQAEYRKAIQDKHCRASLKALIDALDGWEPDATDGATHYLTKRLHETSPPAWARGDNWMEIGAHRFFRDVP